MHTLEDEAPSVILIWYLQALAMPWYKLFDQWSSSWDGILRYNTDSQGHTWLPNWATNGEQITIDILNNALQRGPYVTTFVPETP